MTEERLKELIEKADNDALSPEEELELLEQLNKSVEELERAIAQIPDVDSEESEITN